MRENFQDGRKLVDPVTHLPAFLVSGLHSGDTSIGDIDLDIPIFVAFFSISICHFSRAVLLLLSAPLRVLCYTKQPVIGVAYRADLNNTTHPISSVLIYLLNSATLSCLRGVYAKYFLGGRRIDNVDGHPYISIKPWHTWRRLSEQAYNDYNSPE